MKSLAVIQEFVSANEADCFVFGKDRSLGGYCLTVQPFGIGVPAPLHFRGAGFDDCFTQFQRHVSESGIQPDKMTWVERIRARRGFTPNPNSTRKNHGNEFDNYLTNLGLR